MSGVQSGNRTGLLNVENRPLASFERSFAENFTGRLKVENRRTYVAPLASFGRPLLPQLNCGS